MVIQSLGILKKINALDLEQSETKDPYNFVHPFAVSGIL